MDVSVGLLESTHNTADFPRWEQSKKRQGRSHVFFWDISFQVTHVISFGYTVFFIGYTGLPCSVQEGTDNTRAWITEGKNHWGPSWSLLPRTLHREANNLCITNCNLLKCLLCARKVLSTPHILFHFKCPATASRHCYYQPRIQMNKQIWIN